MIKLTFGPQGLVKVTGDQSYRRLVNPAGQILQQAGPIPPLILKNKPSPLQIAQDAFKLAEAEKIKRDQAAEALIKKNRQEWLDKVGEYLKKPKTDPTDLTSQKDRLNYQTAAYGEKVKELVEHSKQWPPRRNKDGTLFIWPERPPFDQGFKNPAIPGSQGKLWPPPGIFITFADDGRSMFQPWPQPGDKTARKPQPWGPPRPPYDISKDQFGGLFRPPPSPRAKHAYAFHQKVLEHNEKMLAQGKGRIRAAILRDMQRAIEDSTHFIARESSEEMGPTLWQTLKRASRPPPVPPRTHPKDESLWETLKRASRPPPANLRPIPPPKIITVPEIELLTEEEWKRQWDAWDKAQQKKGKGKAKKR